MAINFPASPATNDTYTYEGKTWKWNGSAWAKSAATETGNTEGNTGEIAYYDEKGSVIKGATAFFYEPATQGIYVVGGLSADAGITLANDLRICIDASDDKTIYVGGGVGTDNQITNAVLGFDALDDAVDAFGNVAIGYQALSACTGCNFNVAIGYSALENISDSPQGQVAIGYFSQTLCITGDFNTGIGYNTLRYNKYGSENTAVGYFSLMNLSDDTEGLKVSENFGNRNTALGYSAGGNLTYGDNNLFLGYNAQVGYSGENNQIVLGGTYSQLLSTYAGISAAGATFEGNVHLEGTGNYIQFPDGTTLGSTQTDIIGISVNNGSQVLTTGIKGHRTIPYDCTIIDWRVTSTDTGAIEWDLNYATYANFPTFTAFSIHASEAPGIAASGSKDESSGAIEARWTPFELSAGTIIQFDINSVTSLTNCVLELTIRRDG